MTEEIKEEINVIKPSKVTISNAPEVNVGSAKIDGVSGFLEHMIVRCNNYGILTVFTGGGVQLYNGWIDSGVHVFPIRFQAKTNDGDGWFTYNAEKFLLDNDSILVQWDRKDSVCEVDFRICQTH